MQAWHAKKKSEILSDFEVDEAYGLSKEEIEKRTKEYGPNTLEEKGREFWFNIFLNQFKSPLVWILFLAFGGAFYLGELIDAGVIAAALLVNVVISFIQEYRAGKAFEALAASQSHITNVLRDGVRSQVDAKELVPGDIVFLSAGSIVPADAYILSCTDFSVSEAHITGESAPVHKKRGTLKTEAAVYERTNMAYMGSPVLTGEGHAVIVATGERTEMGLIAIQLGEAEEVETPIEKSIRRLARFLSILIIIVVTLLLVIGLGRGLPVSEIVLLAIALAVSVVPEGLPAAVTAILAIGMERILRKRGLVRNLLAAETLGSTTIILTDKTGTLTEARLALIDVAVGAERGFHGVQLSPYQKELLQAAVRVSDAYVSGAEVVNGRPIERAILSASLDRSVFPDVLHEINKRIDFLPFSSEQRFSASLFKPEGKIKTSRAYYLGAPELLFETSTKMREGDKEVALTKARHTALQETFNALAREGKRVIGVGYKDVSWKAFPRKEGTDEILEKSVFAGFIAFADPVREAVPEALREVQGAGIRTVMVTGDTPETAYAVAVEAGICDERETPITGRMIEHMDDDALYTALTEHRVFARVLPKQKQRLVTVLQDRGEIVAMTGDGVNDAPALQTAAIGVAVGSGTEVAREASDLVLLDDSFAIIVAAIREGRRIMDNLKKAVVHLTSTSFHEVFIITTAILVGLPLPILPAQILWVNILQEGFLTFGFAFEPEEKDCMKRDPRVKEMRTILTKQVRRLILTAGTITGLFSTGLFLWLLSQNLPIEEIRTIMFVVLALDAIMFAVSLKQLHRPFWHGELFNNRYLLFALLFSVLGIVLTLVVPPLRSLLQLTLLTPFDIAVLVFVATVNLLTIEGVKYFTVDRSFGEKTTTV